MRFGIYLADQDRSRTSSQGIITYSVAMTNHLAAALAQSDSCVIFASESIAPELAVPGRVRVRTLPTPANARDRLRRDQVDCARLAKSEQVDAMYFPKGFMPFGMRGEITTIATIHDDIPIRYVRGAWGLRSIRPGHVYAALSILATLRRADVVTCPSEFVASRLRAAGRGSRPLIVTPPGVPAELPADERSDRVLVVTSSAAHKRSAETVEWVEQLAAQNDGRREFVLVGAHSAMLRTLDPPPTTTAMNTEIARSAAVVFNSAYEGFGLPPVEAWALGTPATYPAIEPLRTNLAGVPGSFVPRSFTSFASAVEQVLELDRRAVIEQQTIVRERFSWEESARALLEEARRAVGG